MTAIEKIWKVIRGLNEFTVVDIVFLTGLKCSTVKSYVHALHKFGYLRSIGEERFNKYGQSNKIFRLVKNTGPKAPFVETHLHDPNLGGKELGEKEDKNA